MTGQTFTYMRNKIFAELLQNEKIVKALVVEDKDFLNVSIKEEEQKYC